MRRIEQAPESTYILISQARRRDRSVQLKGSGVLVLDWYPEGLERVWSKAALP